MAAASDRRPPALADERSRHLAARDAAGAGFLMLAANALCAGVGAAIGAVVGALVPCLIAGFLLGFVLAIRIVIKRFGAR